MPQVETAPLSQHRVGSWPQKWPWSVFWLKLCLDSWACGYVKFVHEDEHKLINTDTSPDVNRVIFMGESLPQALLHKHPASLYIFSKSWCSVIKHSDCTRTIWQRRTFVKGGLASAKQVACQTGKLSLSCARDTADDRKLLAMGPWWPHQPPTVGTELTQLLGADTEGRSEVLM